MRVDSRIVREYSDIDFNFKKTSTGDLYKITGVNAVLQSVRNIILTNYQERPFQPYLASNTTSNLFENSHPAMEIELKSSVEEALRNNEPRVQNIKTVVSFENHTLSLELTLKIVNVANEVSLNIDLERLR